MTSKTQIIERYWHELILLSGNRYDPVTLPRPADVRLLEALRTSIGSLDCSDLIAGLAVADGYSGLFDDPNFGMIGFFSTSQILSDYPVPPRQDSIPVIRRSSKGVKRHSYSENRISFAWSDYWIFFQDFDPATGGTSGQIVAANTWDEECRLVSVSYIDFLKRGIEVLGHLPN